VARVNGEVLTGAGVVGGRYNVCTGRAISLNQALAIYQELFPGMPPAEHAAARLGDIRHSLGAPELSRHVLGFSAQVPFEQGLRELVKFFGHA
jgi:nucleoside-diphosphate-sugar epimerase